MAERAKRRKRGARREAVSVRQDTSIPAWLIITLLMAGTIAVYLPLARHAFIDYDDDLYVVQNAHVNGGLSWQTVRWALTSTEESNWHPITWLAHALDCQLFGLDAGGHHLVSLAIHVVNALLLFFLLWRATGALGRSAFVAGLFAWHPLNVQSVAWVAERKNLLCTFFFLLTIAAYGRYVRRPRLGAMAVVVTCFALALASKPMAVTLPFALLLLDWWPLRREPETAPTCSTRESVVRLVAEKWLLFVLSAASCVITVKAQRLGGAVQSLETFPFSARVANALWSYVVYIGKLFVPVNLAVLYPHPGANLATWKPLLAAALLLTITVSVWWQRIARPYLIVGWLWYVGTMFPVIGIVQVGDQAMADRYAYIPLIGLFVLVSWGGAELLSEWKVAATQRRVLAAAALAMMLVVTWRQLAYWRDSVTIWTHSLQVTGDPAMERQLANALIKAGRIDDAAAHLLEAVKVDPGDVSSHANLGNYYSSHGQREEASREYETAVALTERPDLSPQDRPSRMSALLGLGFLDVETGDFLKALTSFTSAIQLDGARVAALIGNLEQAAEAQPSEIEYVQLSLLLHAAGREQDSSAMLDDVVKANPGFLRARQLRDFLNGQAARASKTKTGQEGGA